MAVRAVDEAGDFVMVRQLDEADGVSNVAASLAQLLERLRGRPRRDLNAISTHRDCTKTDESRDVSPRQMFKGVAAAPTARLSLF